MTGQDLLDAGRGEHRRVVLLGVEHRGRALVLPGRPGQRVVVHRQGAVAGAADALAAEMPELLHERLGPGVVGPGRPGGDLVKLVVAVVPAVGAVAAGLLGVVLGGHGAAAAPRLVAQAPEPDPPRLVTAVGLAQSRHRRVTVAGQVFDPLAHFPYGPGSDVAADVGLGAEQVAQRHELVGAEVVVLLDPAPMGVDHDRPPLFGPDAVTPVVFVGEAAARPAQVRDAQGAQGLDDVEPDAALVRDGGVLADVEAAVDAAAQMLGEVPVQVPADPRTVHVHVDHSFNGHRGAFRSAATCECMRNVSVHLDGGLDVAHVNNNFYLIVPDILTCTLITS
ncbi:hypothetical protein JKJ07_38355 [Actinoplanes sp. LDG1-01]|uniref:Uncharacterized protein n=1 Tax=Paractinoplanes lichenicola TaxID=2802976 RepID=A0ABS1W0B5_9ACTN|nr:hypothetical protein [Actinoplanes lichenicola]